MEDTVNVCHDGILDRMREQCPFIKPEDLRFLALVIAGLSSKTVCVLTKTGYKNYYSKKDRIVSKIQASDVHDKDEFVAAIQKKHSAPPNVVQSSEC